MKLSIRQLTLNAMIAAIYVVITIFLHSYGPLQLRLTEMFAHLPMFNKKYSILNIYFHYSSLSCQPLILVEFHCFSIQFPTI